MIPSKKNARRLWNPEEEKQLRQMVEAGKSITMMALRFKRTITAVRTRLGILKISLHGSKKNKDGGSSEHGSHTT
jgi:hypothetical protein